MILADPSWSPNLEDLPIDGSSSCIPRISVVPKSATARAATPSVAIVWAGMEKYKTTDIIEQLGIDKIVQVRNTAEGLGADSKPDFFSACQNQLVLDELLHAASLINEQVELGKTGAVQCTNGRTRSPSTVAAYLLVYQDLSCLV